jgi:hypothetical protein
VTPRVYLGVEGLVVPALALGGYLALSLLVVAGLAPDLSMLASLRGPRVGALGHGPNEETGFRDTHLSSRPAPLAGE